MKKVLYFHHGGALGGAPLSLFYLLQAFPKDRFTTSVCCLQDGAVVDYFNEHGILTYADTRLSCFGHVNGGWFPLTNLKSIVRMFIALLRFPVSVWRTMRILGREKPDLVHINSSVLTPQAVACKLAGVPFVWHVREAAHPGYFGLRLTVLRWMFRHLPDRVICICKANADRLHVPQSKRRVINEIIDFGQFDRTLDGSALRRHFHIPDGKKVVLYCGGTSSIKGGHILPLALERLKTLYPNYVCIVSGHMTPPGLSPNRTAQILSNTQSPLAKAYYAFHKLEKEGFVLLTGFRTDIQNLLAASDCLVFPSTAAHFARPVIEAASMAKPVVASRFPELEEVVKDGKTGVLVPPDNAETLAIALANLLSDGQRMREMGECAYNETVSLFSAHARARETLAVYEEVLGVSLQESRAS